MRVFGVSNEMELLIKEKAARGDKTAQKALAEISRTNNGREPQLATVDGESAIATMMSQLSQKSIEIQKAKMPQVIPFLVPGTEPVFTPKKPEKLFDPFEIPYIVHGEISKKIDDSLKPDTVLETAILAKKTVTGVPPVDPEITPRKTDEIPYTVYGESPEFYYPDIDPEKATWIIDGPEETKRELNKAVIPIAIGIILYFLVWG